MKPEHPKLRLVAEDISVGPPGASPILHGVHVEVSAGEWLGVTGTNGSGKTTLALALAGLAPLRRGRLLLDGEPMVASSGARNRVAAILQEPGSQLLCDRVIDEISLTAVNLGVPADRAECRASRLAERLGIRELHRRPQSLSAGRQQVVLIAAALAARPAVLVADEALAHVDTTTRSRVEAVLAEELGKGLALVWVTQNPAELARCGRVVEVTRSGVEPWSADHVGPAREHLHSIAYGAAIGHIRIVTNLHDDSRIRVETAVEIPIPRSGLVLVTGANGSGKSTLLEAIAGGLVVPEVEVRWLPRRDTEAPLSQPHAPLLVGERPENQIVHEQVADELTFTSMSRGRSRSESLADAVELMKALPLGTNLLGRRTWSLSVGEKRVVLNVAAMTAPTSLLALDEPTAGLNPHGSRAMANLVHQRATLGPVFVATQDSEWICSFDGVRVDLTPSKAR